MSSFFTVCSTIVVVVVVSGAECRAVIVKVSFGNLLCRRKMRGGIVNDITAFV